jgi:hypothetical protein
MSGTRESLIRRIENISSNQFEELALDLYDYQKQHNPLYAKFLKLLGKYNEKIFELSQIPFLPINFFKSHTIKTGNLLTKIIFKSSGTTAQIQSKHEISDPEFYLRNTVKGFEKFYGPIEDYTVFALLPSYLERDGSSLVLMADHFIKRSKYVESGFFLNDFQELSNKLNHCVERDIPVLLLGVTFALLDFAEKFPKDLKDKVIMMETGGMKGRRKELIRTEVHEILTKTFNLSSIHSEYGMTELLSQAYSKGNGLFYPSDTMKIFIRDSMDPFTLLDDAKTGAINIIDLANIDSCAFIATDDLGKKYVNGSFEVLGRFDASDIRGCNLMIN